MDHGNNQCKSALGAEKSKIGWENKDISFLKENLATLQ